MNADQKRAVQVMLTYWRANGAFTSKPKALRTFQSIADAVNAVDGSDITKRDVALEAQELGLIDLAAR